MAGLNHCFTKYGTSLFDRKIIRELIADGEDKVSAIEIFRADILQDIEDLRTTIINPILREAGIDISPKPKVETKSKPAPENKVVTSPKEKVEEKPAPVVNFIKDSVQPFLKAVSNKTEELANVAGKTIQELLSIPSNVSGINEIPESTFRNSEALTKALIDLKIPEESADILVKSWKNFTASYNKITVGLEAEKKVLVDALVKTGLTKSKAEAQVDKTGRAIKDYSEQVQKIVGEIDSFAILQPLTMLFRDADGKIPAQVLFSMFINVHTWMHQNLSPNVFMHPAAMQRFLYGTQDKGDLTEQEIAELDGIGHSWKQVSNMLGKSIANMLKISATDKDTLLFYDNLVNAVGMAAIEILNTPSDNNKDSAPIILEPKTWNFGPAPSKKRLFNNGENYLHINIREGVKKKITKVRKDAFNQAMTVLNKGGEVDTQIPLQKPAGSVITSIKNSFGGVPIKVANTLRKKQQVVWGKSDTMPLFKELAEANMDTLHNLAKLKKVHKTASTDTWQKHAEASNKNKIDNITAILEQDELGNLDNFFYKYSLMNQHRMMMEGHINPQNSKVARALLVPKSTKETYTKADISLFKTAVLSNLGFKLDKNLPTKLSESFDQLMEDPNIIKIIAAINAKDRKINDIAELVLKIQNTYGGNMSVLTAVTALAKYDAFHKGEVKSFSSDITVEADGITNGFAISFLQFPMTDEATAEKFLNMMGTYFGRTREETTHLVSGIFKSGEITDIYMELSNHIRANEGLDIAQQHDADFETAEWSEIYVKTSEAIDKVHPALRENEFRDFVKNPFIVSQYGAGVASITESVAEEMILEIYKQIGEFQEIYDGLDPKARLEFIELTLVPYQNHLDNLLIEFKGIKGKVTLVDAITTSFINPKTKKHFSSAITFDPVPVTERINKVLAPRFNQGLSLLLGSSKDSRDAVIKAGEVLNSVFVVQLEKELDKIKAEGRTLSPSQINELVRTTLIKWLPQYKGPLMSLNEKAFVDLTKQVTDRTRTGSNADRAQFRYLDKNKKAVSRTASASFKKFDNPGPASLIRLIINMDSSLLTSAMNAEPDLLDIYDGIIGSPFKVARASAVYGKKYLEFGMNHSVMQNITDQMNKVIKDIKAEDAGNKTNLMDKVRKHLAKEGFRNLGEPRANLDEYLRLINHEAGRVASQRNILREKINRLGAVSHQMFMADIASINPAAIRSFNDRSNDILNALHFKQREIFFSLAPVKAFSSPVKRALTSLFQEKGTATALDILKEYVPENALDYIKIAQKDSSTTKLAQALNTINKLLTVGDGTSSENALAVFLQMDPNNLDNPVSNNIVIQEFVDKIGEDKIDQFRQDIIDELELFSVAPNFTESISIFDREIEDLKRELLNSLDDLPRENPDNVTSFTIDSTNITKLFEQFNTLSGNYYNSQEAKESHTQVLRDILGVLGKSIDITKDIELTVEEIDGITQGAYDKARGNIRVSMSRQPPAAANGQSPQEVYVHELLHAVTANALTDNSLVARKVERAFNHIKGIIDFQGKHQVFLTGIENPSQEDIEMAKHQYDYLFDNPKNEANRLAEFLAYATTNKVVVDILQNTHTSLPVRDNTLLGWLRSLIDLVMDGFTRMMRRATGNNTHQDMIAVVEQLIEIQEVNKKRASRLFKNYVKVTDKYDEKIKNIFANVRDGIANSATAENLKILNGVVINNIKLHMSGNSVSAAILRLAHDKLGRALVSILLELGEGVLTPELINQLLQVKNNISKQNQILERDIIGWFNDIWKAPDAVKNMTVEQQEGLTDVFLRTELSSLLGANLSPAQIAEIIRNPALIKSNLDKIRELMNLPGNHRAIIYAEELGNYMATTNTHLSNAHQNVATIAKDELTPAQNKDLNLLKYLKAYASLIALQNTDRSTLDLIRPLVDAEFIANSSDNAIIDILLYHVRFTDASLKALFNGNPMQTRQGWIIERVDNLTDMVTGTAAQADEMRKLGYPEAYKLGKIPGVSSAHNTIYVGRNVPEARFVSGILSNTGRHIAGTTLRDILKKHPDFQKADGSPDDVKIRKQIARMARTQTVKAQALKQDPNTKLRPVRDDRGQITDYRVEMSKETKQRLLKPDTAFQNVFAHMHSNASNKQQTIIADKATIDLLVHEQVNLMSRMPEGTFVDILSSNSPFSRDRYWRLPKEVRLYLKQYAVNGEFKVREDIIDKVFGFPALDIGNLEMLQKPSRGRWKWGARMAQHITQTIVSYGVDRIVIGTGSVVAGNLMSNMFALMMRKVPPNYIARKTHEGYVAYQEYQKDSTKMRTLRREIEGKNLPETSEEQKEFLRLKISRENNKLHQMSEAGLDSIIVEDLNESSNSGYFSRMNKILKREKYKGVRDVVPKTLVDIGKTAFMTKSSAPYRASKHVVQLSDFLARYVMIEHAMEVKGQDFNTASFEAINAFVLFDENVTPTLDAINSVAGTLFVSYWMRNQRAARALIKNSPLSVLLSAGVQESTGINTLASIPSSFYGMDFSPNILQGENVFNKVTEVTGVANLLSIF